MVSPTVRSASQKFLFVISIIDIVFGVLMLLMALLSFVGIAGLGAADVSSELEASGITGQDVAVTGAVIAFAGLFSVVAGALFLVEGILGIRAANDNQKIMPVWVLSIISLALNAISLVVSIVQGTFSFSSLISLALAGVIFYAANNVKKEAGK